MADLVTIGFKADSSQVRTASNDLNRLTQTGAKTDKSVTSLTKSFFMLAGVVGSVSAALSALNKTVDITREFDRLNAQLITATGGAKNAAIAFSEIQKFAATTPFDLKQTTSAFVQLTNFGLDPSARALKSYGNTASALGKDLSQFIEAVADAATFEFERLKEFGIKSKTQGDNISFTFQGVTKTVRRESSAIEGYLRDLGENQFAGAMSERMNTLDGDISNLGDTWDTLFLNISQHGVGDIMRDSVQEATKAIQSFDDFLVSGQLEASIGVLSIQFEYWAEDLGVVLDVMGKMIDDAAKYWGVSAENASDSISNAFLMMPTNIKTAIKIAAVELSVLVDYADFIGDAMVSAIDLSFKVLGAKARVYAKQLALDLNPFAGNSNGFNFERELSAINQEMVDSYADIFTEIDKNAERVRQVRLDSITDIIAEHDAVVRSVEGQIDYIDQLGKALENQRKNRAKGDVLGTFKVKPEDNEIEKQSETLTKLIDQVDNFGGAWSRTGNIITDSIGDIASGLNDYAKRISEITILQKKLEAERDKAGVTAEDRLRAEQSLIKLSKESAQAQISGIASVAGAASQMFSEQSKGREKLHKVEQAFTAIEIAMAFEKAAANALVAITTQGSGDPYTAFARIAAMGAIMAGLGVFSGSTGGGSSTLAADRQATQGTGTVLGSSDKSQSISESFEAFKDIEDDQLTELKAIKNNMSQLSNGIAALAVSLISDVEFGSSTISGMGTQYGYDKTLGADFGKKLSVLSGGIDLGVVFELGGAVVDSVLKSFKSTKKEVTDSGIRIGAQSLSDILNDGLEASYFDVIETTKKKNFGLSKSKSSETETSAIDSNVTDQIGNIFKMLGENVSESIAILGVEYSNSLNDFILDVGDVSFKDLTGEEIQAELESIISKQGDLLAEFGLDYLDVFQKIGEGALETLNRLAIQTSVFRDSLDTLNVSFSEIPKADLILFADNIIDLVGGLDSFMSLSSGFVDSFFSDAEKTQKLGDDLGEVFKSLNVPMSKSKDEFRSLVESIDLTSESGQELFSTLLQIAPAFAEYSENLIDAEEKIKESRLDAAKNAFDMLEKSVNVERDRAKLIFDSAKSSYSLEIERINGLRVGLDNLVGLSKTLNASVTLDQALSSARSGDFGFASNFKTTDLKQSDFSSFSDFAIAQAKQANKIESLALLAQDQMNELSLQEETAMMTLDIAEKQYEDEISRLDILIEVNLEMLNAALSIETSIKNLNESLYDFNNSINAINPQLVVARDNRESEQIRQRETEENVRAYLQEMNKSAKSTAKILQNIYLGGLDTRAIS